MKVSLIGAVLLGMSFTAAVAQTAPAPSPPVASATAPGGVLNGDSPIEAIAATPSGKASLEKNIPEVLPHPAYEQFKGMSLRQLAPLAGGIITDERIAAVETDLKAAK